MTVTSIKRIKDGSGGDIQGPHQTSITLGYRVETDNPFDTPAEIRLAMPLKWGDFLGTTGLMCQGESYDFDQKGPGYAVWNVTLDFSSLQLSQEEQEREEKPNPLDRRTRCSVTAVRYGELTILDKNGNAKRTSAGEIYEAKEKDVTRYTVNLSKNVSAIPDWVWDLQDKVNDDAVTIRGRSCAAGTLKFSLERVPEIVIENNVRHFPLAWTLDYRRDGWLDKRVDAGFYYFDGGELRRIMVKNDEGVLENAVTEQWLDSAGFPLRDTVPNPQPGDETINEFEDYEEGDFSVMPLAEIASGNAGV